MLLFHFDGIYHIITYENAPDYHPERSEFPSQKKKSPKLED